MKIGNFSYRGMAPRISDRLLPNEASAQAINARLLNGSLTSWKRPALVEALQNAGVVRTIFKLDDTWLSFEDEVEVARGTILGDEDFRTYITGLDVPRFTTKALAVTQSGATPPYPFETRPLGVPAPEDAPTLTLSVDQPTEGSITIINPGAEEGDDTGWTQTTPDLTVYENGDIPGIVADTGTFWFYGGTNNSGEYYQSFNADTVNVAPGQNLTLSWRQATGAAGSQAQLGLRFYDAGVNLVGEEFAEMIAPTPANTWVSRSVTARIPADTVTFRIVMKFQNVGGGVTDAYIDTIALQAESLDYSSDGSDLVTWTQSATSTAGNNYRSVVQQDIGGVYGNVFVFRSDQARPYIYRPLGYADSASFRVEFDMRMNYSDSRFHLGLGLNAGIGSILRFQQDGVTKAQISGYGTQPTGITAIQSYSVGSSWVRVVVLGARSGTNQYTLTITVTNKTTGAIVADAVSTTINLSGGELYFAFQSNADGAGQRGYIDNILSSVVPDDGQGTAETTLTSYIYRYVNDFGEASAPGLPSRIIQRASTGVSVTVTTPTFGPTGYDDYGITYKQIYRAATGSAGTVYRFVAEIPLAQADYVDVLDDEDLGEVLDSEDWDLPPSDLRYILALPNGIMVGASKNQLCFSVQNRPHAWPVAYRLPTDTDITGLGNIDNAVIIGTKSFVYTASGNSPDSYSMSKPGAPHACQSARSFAYLLRVGCVFAGPDGLMAVNGPTEVQNLTEGIFTREQWQAIDPTTITAVAHDDMYFWWYGNHGAAPVIPETGGGATENYVYRDTFTGALAALTTHTPDVAPVGFAYAVNGSTGLELDGTGRVRSTNSAVDGSCDSTASSPALSIALEFPWTIKMNATAVENVDETVSVLFTGSNLDDEMSVRLRGASAGQVAVRTRYGRALAILAEATYTIDAGTLTKDITVVVDTNTITTTVDGVELGVINYAVTMSDVDSIQLLVDSNPGPAYSYMNEVGLISATIPETGTVETGVIPETGTSVGGGYMLDTRASGNGLIKLSYHASAAAVDIERDSLNMVLDDYSEPGEIQSADLVIGFNELYEFNADTVQQRYQWDSKLFLLPYPMALQWCRVRARDYTDVLISFYADDLLLYTKTVTSNKAFRIRVRQDYSRMTYTINGSSEVYSVQISDDIDELE